VRGADAGSRPNWRRRPGFGAVLAGVWLGGRGVVVIRDWAGGAGSADRPGRSFDGEDVWVFVVEDLEATRQAPTRRRLWPGNGPLSRLNVALLGLGEGGEGLQDAEGGLGIGLAEWQRGLGETKVKWSFTSRPNRGGPVRGGCLRRERWRRGLLHLRAVGLGCMARRRAGR